MEKQEQAELLQQLQRELEALREQFRRQQDSTQHDFEAALAAKDAIIEQLRRDLQEMQAKLDEADEKLLHLTTSKAAELVSHWYGAGAWVCVPGHTSVTFLAS